MVAGSTTNRLHGWDVAALDRLLDSYWDRDWRAEHRGLGRYPEHALWEAAWGFADLVSTLATG